MSILPRSIPPKKLIQSITSASTSFKINNILDWDGETALTSGDFGTQAFGVFLNDSKTRMELFEFDPATIASSSITILNRGLYFNGAETELAANKREWSANETTVLLGTNTPQLLNNFLDKARDQTITGYKSVPTPTAAAHIATKAYVDLVAGGSATADSIIESGYAGETIAAGNLVYLDDTDNEWKKCDADTAATVQNVMLGIAQGSGTNGNQISGGVLRKGVDTTNTGLTNGALYYAGNTAGAISSSTGTTERVIGFGNLAGNLVFDPTFYYIMTAAQKAGLASTTDLSSSNKVVSQKDFQIGAEVYAADAGASDTYAITLSPAPAAYTNGMQIKFKANTLNTGPATLNVNSLGAIAITKNNDQPLQTGDIEANQIVTVTYNSTGPTFQMDSHVADGAVKYSSQVITRVLNATGAAVTYAHGLGVVPKRIKISGYAVPAVDQGIQSEGTYNGSTHASITMFIDGSGTSSVVSSTSNTIQLLDNSSVGQTAIATFDATNVTLTWSLNGSPASVTARLLLEVWI